VEEKEMEYEQIDTRKQQQRGELVADREGTGVGRIGGKKSKVSPLCAHIKTNIRDAKLSGQRKKKIKKRGD
jgi:hypothetical protein